MVIFSFLGLIPGPPAGIMNFAMEKGWSFKTLALKKNKKKQQQTPKAQKKNKKKHGLQGKKPTSVKL